VPSTKLVGMFTHVRAGSLREAQTCVQLPHNLQNFRRGDLDLRVLGCCGTMLGQPIG
jgi:hypothetical protein